MADLTKDDLAEFEQSFMKTLMGLTSGNSSITNENLGSCITSDNKDVLEDPNNFGGTKYNPEYNRNVADDSCYEDEDEDGYEPYYDDEDYHEDDDYGDDWDTDSNDSDWGSTDNNDSDWESADNNESGKDLMGDSIQTPPVTSSIIDTDGRPIVTSSPAASVVPEAPKNPNIVSRPPRNYKNTAENNVVTRTNPMLSRSGVDITYSPVIVFLRDQGEDMGYPIVLSSESREVNDLVFGSNNDYTVGYVGVLERHSSSNHPISISLDGKSESNNAGVAYNMIWFPEYKGAKVVSGFAGIRYRTGDAVEVDTNYKGKTQGIDFWDGTPSEIESSKTNDIFEDINEEPKEEGILSQMIQRQADEIIDLRKQIADLTRYKNMEYNVGMQSEDAFNSTSAFRRYSDNMKNFFATKEMSDNLKIWDTFFSNNKTPQENIVQPEPIKETYAENMDGVPLRTDGTSEEYLESLADFRRRLLEDIIFKFGGLENIHTFCVEGDHTLTINKVSYQPKIAEEVILTFPLDVRRACRGGAFACIFDYSALASMSSLRVVEFPSESFMRNYVAPNLGFNKSFRPDYLFDASSSLQQIIYNGFKLSRHERNDYINQYNMEYGNKACKINEACNNWVFENLTKGGFGRISDCWNNKNWGIFRKTAYTALNLAGSAVGAGANAVDYVGKTGIREAGKLFRKAFTSTKI